MQKTSFPWRTGEDSNWLLFPGGLGETDQSHFSLEDRGRQYLLENCLGSQLCSPLYHQLWRTVFIQQVASIEVPSTEKSVKSTKSKWSWRACLGLGSMKEGWERGMDGQENLQMVLQV
jgi:hypothetical protein